MIDISKWGKDHWSLLAYVETCCVERMGLDYNRMRCNENKHPLLRGAACCNIKWESIYSTRSKEGLIEGHDDWDCLEDLDNDGFIKILNTPSILITVVEMTTKGTEAVHQIRKHKADGGTFTTFEYK